MESIRSGSSEGSSLAGGPHRRRPVEDVAHRSALRLTFAYRESDVELVLMEAIDMIVPPSLDLGDQPPGSAFWIELQDGKQTPLYRRSQRHPLDPAIEVRTDDPERPIAYVDSGRTHGEFTLLVPSLSQARALVLYEWSRPKDPEDRDVPPAPSEIGRFAIGRAIDTEAIARDTIPPRTVSDALGAYVGSATIHLRASDNTGHVASTHHRLDEGEPAQGMTVSTKERGEHTLVFWSVDRAGNIEPENRVTFTVHQPAKRGAS